MEATVNDIIKVMDGIAPPNLAEPWDNVGLLVGRSSNTVKKLMVALDVSPEVVEQAVEHKVQMLVTHHPVIFDPIKKMTDRSWQHKLLLDCAENKIAVYSAHTSLDSVLKLDNIIAGDAGRRVSKVAVCGGAGAEFIDEALAAGADTFVTGDVKYHTAQNAVYSGLNIIDATHQGTELPMINTLADRIALRLTSGGFNAQVLVAKESKILQYL